jgi:tetratricopeptide (TPR) repeat protein
MQTLLKKMSMKTLSSIVLVCFLGFQATCFLPRSAYAGAADDLKKIEYKYYFRGDYEKAISELRAFLERSDLTSPEIIEAREYLAASLILSGASQQGKDQYLELLKMDSSYKGPDPSVFKPIIIATYDEAQAEYASMVIRSVPEAQPTDATTSSSPATEATGKPLYKKWWFYMTMAAVILIVAGAAGSGDDEAAPPKDTGTVTVEVGVQ